MASSFVTFQHMRVYNDNFRHSCLIMRLPVKHLMMPSIVQFKYSIIEKFITVFKILNCSQNCKFYDQEKGIVAIVKSPRLVYEVTHSRIFLHIRKSILWYNMKKHSKIDILTVKSCKSKTSQNKLFVELIVQFFI